ncbi:hypothetical protein [uncultured Clostridium sp.]|jgi:hypothetical protein|uniref:hypothetical protein n=1 Tax=uncultured Clostridium sp. TaxID=59620 RepID=UPI002623A6E8|nr:hypothetical protein [uncultured Clostridium sp.]
MENIKTYLEENNFEVISNSGNQIVIAYKFDLVELNAARTFVDELEDSSDSEKDDEYKAYLADIASDNLEDVLEEILDEFDIELSYEITELSENKQMLILKK